MGLLWEVARRRSKTAANPPAEVKAPMAPASRKRIAPHWASGLFGLLKGPPPLEGCAGLSLCYAPRSVWEEGPVRLGESRRHHTTSLALWAKAKGPLRGASMPMSFGGEAGAPAGNHVGTRLATIRPTFDGLKIQRSWRAPFAAMAGRFSPTGDEAQEIVGWRLGRSGAALCCSCTCTE